jgi:hypothetical protein
MVQTSEKNNSNNKKLSTFDTPKAIAFYTIILYVLILTYNIRFPNYKLSKHDVVGKTCKKNYNNMHCTLTHTQNRIYLQQLKEYFWIIGFRIFVFYHTFGEAKKSEKWKRLKNLDANFMFDRMVEKILYVSRVSLEKLITVRRNEMKRERCIRRKSQ